MDIIIKNPKGSYVYSSELTSIHTTPTGSHIFYFGVFYKHQIPSRLNTKLCAGKFNIPGNGAFSYSHSQIDSVVKYIINQKEHHKKQTFREEYIDFLKKFEIEFKEEYLFKWIE